MLKYIVLLLLPLLPLQAQQVKAWIFFSDKNTSDFNAGTYFTETNKNRKALQGLPAYDWYDLPVNSRYASDIKPFCDSITFLSRWMNAACVYTSYDRLTQIKQLAFVKDVEITELELMLMENRETLKDLHQGEVNLVKAQTTRMQADLFQKNGLTGKNVTIAIIDGGFRGYQRNKTLERARNNGQIKHTYDFIRKKSNVDKGSTHGTAVLSCIIGAIDDVNMGCAPDANILLYRTEKAFNEKMVEEEYWMAAMEEADRQGADIINTSLGYSTRRYFPNDMNGKKSLLARAANIAAKKGVLVVCSAGNEGDIKWKVICTPADADSALAVGAINPWTGVQASWSSYGPSADQRVKPNVSAFGYVMAADNASGVNIITGTSFSSPLTAGFAACIKQKFPQLTAMELMQKIEQAADLYPYYDYAHGYGVPLASRILEEIKEAEPTFEIIENGDSLKIMLNEKDFSPSFLQVRGYYTPNEDTSRLYTEVDGEDFRKSVHFYDGMYADPTTTYIYTSEPGYFYYRTDDPDLNRTTEYAVTNVRSRLVYKTKRTGSKLKYTFHYRGYTREIEF